MRDMRYWCNATMFSCPKGGGEGQDLGLKICNVALDYFEMEVDFGGVVEFTETFYGF